MIFVFYLYQDRNGNLAVGAISGLVDVIGATLVYNKDESLNVSSDMSISYLSMAKLNVGSLPLSP